MQNTQKHKTDPKPTGPSSPFRTADMRVQNTVHNCGTQHSTEQLWLLSFLAFRQSSLLWCSLLRGRKKEKSERDKVQKCGFMQGDRHFIQTQSIREKEDCPEEIARPEGLKIEAKDWERE